MTDCFLMLLSEEHRKSHGIHYNKTPKIIQGMKTGQEALTQSVPQENQPRIIACQVCKRKKKWETTFKRL